MLGYNTSKDFRKLRNLLDDGKTVVTMTPASDHFDAECALSSKVSYEKGDEYYHIMDEYSSTDMSDEDFAEWMRELRLQFIIPGDIR